MVLNTFVAAEVSLIQPAPIVDIWRNGKFSTPLGTTHNGQALSSRAQAFRELLDSLRCSLLATAAVTPRTRSPRS